MSSATAAGARLATPSIFTRTFMLGIMGTLSAYLASWENADRLRDTYLDKNIDYGDTFDFIIVGAGTAGAIVANRLSDKYKVLLLEAGGDPHPFQAVPLLSNFLLNYAELDWRHVTMPQKQAFRGSVQSRASISQGRGLGGTTNLDYLMYLRGHPKDFDSWADMLEDPSWSYKHVSEYFKSLEQYAGPWAPENHGDSGELKIRPPSFTGLGQQFCEAAQANGYKQTDLNSFFTEGCDIINYPTKKGYRDSVYNSFVRKFKDRRTLVIHKYAHVNKILIRGNNDTAYGVEYDRHGKSLVAYAKKEIIVAAGAIQTPKILMLSGIGPKADLDSIGIPVKADLPVGKNLQDHLSVYLGPFFVEKGRSLDIDRDVSTGSVLSLAKDGGPLTTTGFQAAAIVSSGLEKLHGGRNWPDLQLTMYGISHHKSVEEDLNHAYKLKKDLLKTYLEHSKGLDSFSVVVSGGRPKSTGTVKLLNRNPYAPLIINPNYLDKIYDVVVMVDGIKKALRIVENSTVFYNDLNTRFTRQTLPGCEMYRFRSDAYFECYVRTMSVSLGNVAGTAPMGTVLNSKLQVKGIKSLRVMDASAMPSIVTTSTGAAVMMIAEKGADMLLTQWEGTSSEASLLKDTNLVLDKIKESASHVKFGLDSSSKTLLDTLKITNPASNSQSSLPQLNLNDLKKLTKSMGSLASLLEPATAGSIVDNVYTGSFDLGSGKSNATFKFNPLAAIAGLRPMLKSQFGGLYQHLLDDEGPKATKVEPANKGSSSQKVKTKQVEQLSKGTPLNSGSEPDPMKLIQNLIKNSMKQIENITAMTSAAGSSLKAMENSKSNNMTLEDIFGIADGGHDEYEDYIFGEALKLTSPPKTTTTTTTRKPVKVTTSPSATTVVTAKVVPTTRTTTSTTTPTTTTTRKPVTTPSTTKKPFIDYSYEVLPVPMTKSKDISSLNAQASATAKPIYSKPIQVQTIQIKPSPIPLRNVQTFKVPPVPGPVPGNSNPEAGTQKIKNLEALAQIQHETLTKLRQKQQPKPTQTISTATHQLGVQGFRNPPPPPLPQQMLSQQQYVQQIQGQPASPSLNILPPPPRGRYPVPNLHHQISGTRHNMQHHQHPIYNEMLSPVHPYIPPNQPGGLLRPQPQPQVDPSNLKSAVHTIMNAKYAPPSANPFAGVLDVFGKAQQGQEVRTESTVLKSLQLRANVDKFINYPYSAPVSPIPITHRPTPPPRTFPTTPGTPPPPMGLEELRQEEDGGVFAPIKDMLQPLKSLSSLMKAPLSLLPNPFKTETETTTKASITSSFLPSFLSSSIFSQRVGPMSPSSYQSRDVQNAQQPLPVSNANAGSKSPLSVVLPRFFMNQSTFKGEISPEQFILALANLTTELPKPFVLEPSKTFTDSSNSQQQASSLSPGGKEEKGKKLLDESISEILSQLQNHHFASLTSSNSHLDEYADDITDAVDHSQQPSGNNIGVNSANEILNMDYRRFPTTVKASVVAATPKVKISPPVEFHKSIWAKEPSIPSKSLHFKIKIV